MTNFLENVCEIIHIVLSGKKNAEYLLCRRVYWHLRGVDTPKRTIRINKLTTISGSYHPCIICTYYISPCSRILVASHTIRADTDTLCTWRWNLSLSLSFSGSVARCFLSVFVCFTRYLCNIHGLASIIPIILARKYVRVLFFIRGFAVIVVAHFKLGFCFQFFTITFSQPLHALRKHGKHMPNRLQYFM